ncbi:MAG: polysaccharide deacetylase family protein [Bacteroidales bacterium]|nr:polysaccharide deacetylase family protein [Bacteroidales bacterium]
MILEKINNDTHFMSVDMEDWYHSAFLRHYTHSLEINPRIEQSTQSILQLFDEYGIKATFFVLGELAQKHPALIRRIFDKGHEIASHGLNHTPLWKLNPDSFEKNLMNTKKILSDITGKAVKGFRAPYASLDLKTSWAVDILAYHNILYDSSIFPVKTPMYGLNKAPLTPYRISSANILKDSPDGRIIEIPFTISKLVWLKMPCSGGIYGRFFPMFLLKYLLTKTAKQNSINFFFHPWETDKDTPRIKVPAFNRLVTYYNTTTYLKKIEKLMKTFKFTSFEDKLSL